MDAEKFLNGFINLERMPGAPYPLKLGRMRHLLSILDFPPKGRFHVITVAGSKGKGSTAAMVASVLRHAGFRTGLYTSPHLVRWEERIQCDGERIREDESSALASFLFDKTRRKEFPYGQPTYFEVLTAMALLHFLKKKAGAVVLEVGLGGEFDATNACDPTVSVLTPIGLDHRSVLGGTLERIAETKCGIIRPKGTVVTSFQAPQVMEVIRRRCQANAAQLLSVADDLKIEEGSFDEEEQSFWMGGPWGREGPFVIPLLGRHQIQNAACAYLAVRKFAEITGAALSEGNLDRGFARVRWPGRLEKASDAPAIVLDGAHTRESAEAAASSLRRHFRFDRLHMILGMLSDKDPNSFLGPFRDRLKTLWLTPVKSERTYLPAALRRKIGEAPFPVLEVPNFCEALQKAAACAGAEDLILVTGSLYLVGEAKESLTYALLEQR